MAPPGVKRPRGSRVRTDERRVDQVFRLGVPLVELRVFAGPEETAEAMAEELVRRANDAVSRRGRFSVALAGGSTPNRSYEILVARRREIQWGKVHVFWGDERLVPPSHPDSNFRAAQDLLLSHVPIPQANVHPIRTEGHGPDTAAALYVQELRAFFGLGTGRFPRFDLVLLGLGTDGHTASLFPGSEALRERARMVAAPLIAKLGTYRITLTLPVLNSARAVIFLVNGAHKADALARALEAGQAGEQNPASLVHPRGGALVWIVDRAAASRLHQTSPVPP